MSIQSEYTGIDMDKPGRVFLRVYTGVAHHFPTRGLEWCFAVMLVNWGLIGLFDPDLLEQSRAFATIRTVAPSAVWAYLCIMIGGLRLVALVVNGTFAGTWYSRYSPLVRAVMGGLSCFFWFTASMAAVNYSISPGLAVYPVILTFEILNIGRSSTEASQSVRAGKSGTPA